MRILSTPSVLVRAFAVVGLVMMPIMGWTTGCQSPRVVAPTLGVQLAITRHATAGTATRFETEASLVLGATPRPPLAPSPNVSVPKRHGGRSRAACRLEPLCAWEREVASFVALLLAHGPSRLDVPGTEFWPGGSWP